MRARERVIAGRYREPEDYGIPELPARPICRSGRGSLAFAAGAEEPSITAENPTKVRR